MALEIEKKYLVMNFKDTLEKLKADFGQFKKVRKEGFWWCDSHNTIEKILNVKEPKLSRKMSAVLKNIGEFHLSDEEFQFVRLRVNNSEKKVITFKNKSLINNTEQNVEYEFVTDDEKFKNITNYLKENASIFYYNIKDSWVFEKNDVKIEISELNDLRDTYLEVETVGTSEKDLHDKLNKFLIMMTDYKLKEETRNYVELFFHENHEKLKSLTLGQYSREGFKLLQKYL